MNLLVSISNGANDRPHETNELVKFGCVLVVEAVVVFLVYVLVVEVFEDVLVDVDGVLLLVLLVVDVVVVMVVLGVDIVLIGSVQLP